MAIGSKHMFSVITVYGIAYVPCYYVLGGSKSLACSYGFCLEKLHRPRYEVSTLCYGMVYSMVYGMMYSMVYTMVYGTVPMCVPMCVRG